MSILFLQLYEQIHTIDTYWKREQKTIFLVVSIFSVWDHLWSAWKNRVGTAFWYRILFTRKDWVLMLFLTRHSFAGNFYSTLLHIRSPYYVSDAWKYSACTRSWKQKERYRKRNMHIALNQITLKTIFIHISSLKRGCVINSKIISFVVQNYILMT